MTDSTYTRGFTENVKRHLGLGNRQRREAHDRDIRDRQQYLAGRPAARERALKDGARQARERDWERDAMHSRPPRASR